MKSQMKLKYTLVFTIISFFIANTGFAQTYSDKEIGFDVERITLILKENGVLDKDLSSEISMLRESLLLQYKEMKKNDDAILKNTESVTKTKGSTNKVALASAEILANEKATLIALYNNTGGNSWLSTINNQAAWPVNDPDAVVSTYDYRTNKGWYGVQVGADGRVTQLNFSSNKLNGVLPDLSALTELTWISFQNNTLSGNLSSFSKLTKLNALNLYGCRFEGTLESITDLVNLITFDASSNNITGGFPDNLKKLSKLQKLSLWVNKLEGDYSILGQIPSLTNLVLTTNKFNIPGASDYNNRSIPESFKNLINLTELRLESHGIKNNIDIIGNMINLATLQMSNNQIEGNLPASFLNLKKLTFLDLGMNKITDISILSNLTTLQSLFLDSNKINLIPSDFNRLTSLNYLDLNANKLSGSIPDLTSLPLVSFKIGYNGLRFVDFINQFPLYKSKLTTFEYSGQAEIDSYIKVIKPTGNPVTLIMCEDKRFYSGDTFQWYRFKINSAQSTAVEIPGATNREYFIPNLTIADEANYYCLSQNPQITNPANSKQNLILQRAPITLNIINCTPVTGTLNPTTQNTFTNTDINFSLATTATGLTYEWTFQNVSNSTTFTSSSATYSYATPGSYNVTLVVTDSNGCKTTFTKIMEVAAKPACVAIVGEIKTSSEKIIPNQNVTFSFETAATNFTYNWIFYNQAFVEIGRAATSTASRSYSAPGDYLVALELVDQNGCKTYKGLTVKVVADCPLIEGTIKVNTEHPTLYTTAIFTFETTATNLTYSWTVKIPENGGYYNYATGGNPFELYLQHGPGDYKIMLEVKDANGCITKFEKIITAAFDCTTVHRDISIQNVNKHSYGFNPLVLVNTPNPFTFYPPAGEGEIIAWTMTNLNGDIVSSTSNAEFIITPTALGAYKLNFKIIDTNGCESNFINDIKVVDRCDYTNEERLGAINFVEEYSNGAAFINLNETKTLEYRFYDNENPDNYAYYWSVFDPNNTLITSFSGKTFPIALTTPGFHKVVLFIEDLETDCQMQISKSIGTIISNSCTDTNPKSQIVKGLYFDLVKNLIARSMMGETDEQINASPANAQFTALIPYITNGVKDKIYNYKSVRDDNKNEETNSLRSIDFSFSPDRVSDVRVYFKWGMYYDPQYDSYEDLLTTIESKIYFSLTQYTSPDVPLISCYVDNGGKIKGNNQVKPGLDECSRETIAQYIDFCPAENCKPIIGVLKSTDTAGISKGSDKIKAKPVSKK